MTIGRTFSALADLTPIELLWSLFGLVTIFAVTMTVIFIYHWFKFSISGRFTLLAGIIYLAGTLFLLTTIALTIQNFTNLT